MFGMQKPEQGYGCRADNTEEEFPVAMLRISEFVDQNLRARNVNESAAGQAQNDWVDENRRVFNANTNADASRLDQGKEEENEEYCFLRFCFVLSELNS